MSTRPDHPGAFPTVGPVPYLFLSETEVRAASASGPFPPETNWIHATYPDRLASVLREGLIPSCWWGGDSCAVFGFDRPDEVPMCRRDDWLLEVRSRALPGSVKAWWVPPTAIQRLWRGGQPVSIHEGLMQGVPAGPPIQDGCSCDLAEIVREQQAGWRALCEGRFR
jgi:hypothetical protein